MSGYFFNDSLDLKLIILFISQNFKRPVSISDISDIILSGGYADYFQTAQCFAELEDTGLLTPATEKGKYIVSQKGLNASMLFSKDLPFSVKEEIINSIKSVRKKEVESLSVTSEFKENRMGSFDLFSEITEAGIPIFSMSLVFPTKDSAAKAASEFKKNAEKIYKDIIKNLS